MHQFCIFFRVREEDRLYSYTLERNIHLILRMDAPTPATPPKQNRWKQLQNGRSRLFHCIMAVVYFTVLLTAVISFGTFAAKQNEIASLLTGTGCILHATFEDQFVTISGLRLPRIPLGQDTPCLFSIWGEVLVACGALAMFIIAIVVAILGTEAASLILALINLVLITPCLFLALSVSSVITAGLTATCNAFTDGLAAASITNSGQCQDYPYLLQGQQVFFYTQINIAKDAAWVGTSALIVAATVYIAILILYAYAALKKPKSKTTQAKKAGADCV